MQETIAQALKDDPVPLCPAGLRKYATMKG